VCVELRLSAKEWFLNRALRIDDDVAEALYSGNRRVPTYTKSQITPLKNNYNGATLILAIFQDESHYRRARFRLEHLSRYSESDDRFSVHEQITRLVCVEGWSAIAGWAGLRFGDLLRAYPPMSQAKWARVESSVNLDNSGNPDPYFMSIDLATAASADTARHTLQRPAPYRGSWSTTPPTGSSEAWFEECESHYQDYLFCGRAKRLLAERGYSRYDGI